MLVKLRTMKGVLLLGLISLAAASTISKTPQRIIGGSVTTINDYPMVAALLYSENLSNYYQWCGGTIINNRSFLTATHCVYFSDDNPNQWRIRVGSSFANSGGIVHNVEQLIIHPHLNQYILQVDITIVRSATNFVFSDVVAQGSIAGPDYVVADNEEVWAIGWGTTSTEKPEQLHHVKIYVINEEICRSRVGELIDGNQICAGILDEGGRGQCYGDSGGPLLHRGVLVGITSFGYRCADAYFPGVNTKVASFSKWIQDNA